MDDRDHFAAAALTGLLAQGDDGSFSEESYARATYRWADAMLRERDASAEKCSDVRNSRNAKTTDHDAAPAARAVSDEDRTDKSATSHRLDRPGDTSVAESATPDGYAYTGWPYPKGKMASISDAEIDALECVVEDGRIVGMSVYGRLRSLLVRLRPEWEDESDRPQPVKDGDSDRSKPINDARLAALDELSAMDQELELEHGVSGNPMIKPQTCKAAKTDATQPRNGTPAEGSVPREGIEPVAWWIKGVEYDTGCEYEYADLYQGVAEAAAAEGCTVVPLYRQPQPTLTDEEREAVATALAVMAGTVNPQVMAALRGLLERTA